MLVVTVSTLAGLVAHHGIFIHGEWHLKIRKIVVWHVFCASLSFYALLAYSTSSLKALHWLLVGIACYLTSLFTSISLYRLLFHPLKHFRGPKLAALTQFWHVYQARNSTNYLLMEKMNKEYGALVRTGPNEITIFHPTGVDILDGSKNTTTKDAFYDVLRPRRSAIFERDEGSHRLLRMTWTQSLSTKSMDVFRPRIAEQAQTLRRCIDSYNQAPVDINSVMTWFSFDAMGDIVFGNDFGMMKNRITNSAIFHQHRALALLGPVIDTMWIARLAFEFLPFFGKVRDWMKMVDFCEDQMTQRLKQKDNGKLDMAKWFIDEYHSLKGSESDMDRRLLLNGSAISAVVAGSDTTRAALIATWWYLATNPEHAVRIQQEVDGADVTDANNLALLPHLNGVINEVLRLVPPAMTGNGRITGPDGLLIGETFIPPFTKVTAPKYVIHRFDSVFERPDDFIPERWYSQPDLIRDRRAFAPFSFGGRQCVGKVLAYVELRLVTAILLKHYNVKFAPDYDPKIMWRDMKDQVTAQPGLVQCVFEPRNL